MSDLYSRKTITSKALDVDTEKRRVKVAIGHIGNIDHDKDVITPGAVDKTIREKGPTGTKEIWFMTDHSYTIKAALSKFSEMGVDEKNNIWGVGEYRDTYMWREVAWPLYEKGDINQHSIGYAVKDSAQMNGYRELRQLELFEGSAVLWGANNQTPVIELVKSHAGIDTKKGPLDQLEGLIKAIKNGKFEDQDHRSLLILELRRIQADIADSAKSTQPEEQPATAPELEEAVKLIKAFTLNELILQNGN